MIINSKYFTGALFLLLFVTLGPLSVEAYDLSVTFSIKSDTTKMVRSPYLQTTLADSVTIRWKTNRGEKCYVRYGKTSQMEKKVDGAVEVQHGSTMNEVTIKKLEPDTKYFYQVYTDNHLLVTGEDYYFVTASLEKEKPFSFFAMGDIGMPLEDGGYPDVTANQINRLETRPNFGLLLGDLVYYDGESEYYDERFFNPLSPLLKNIPVYPVLGNHDWRSVQSYLQEWKLPNNEHYYSFEYGNTLFIGLDSKNGEFYDFENQKTWLKETLKKAQNNYDWIIVYLHFNGRSCTEKEDVESVISLYPIFAHNNVDLVINGHAHTYERLHPYDKDGNVITKYTGNIDEYNSIEQGFISITTGAGGDLRSDWSTDECHQSSIVASKRHIGHFCRFTIHDQKLKMEAISSLTGETFDEFIIEK